MKTKEIFCILFISSLIWITTYATDLFFRLSMMFLSRYFITTFKSRAVDPLIISFVFETGLEARLMMIDVSVFWFWSIFFKTRFFRRASFDWVESLTLIISKALKNSKTRWIEIVFAFIVSKWVRSNLLWWKNMWHYSFAMMVDADTFKFDQTETLDFIFSMYFNKIMMKYLIKWDLQL